MQAATWRLTAGGRSAAHDLCICAPTGSGKTLAYALPIIAALSGCAAACPAHLPSTALLGLPCACLLIVLTTVLGVVSNALHGYE